MSERWVLDGGREGSGVLEMNSRTLRKILGVLGMKMSSESAYRFAQLWRTQLRNPRVYRKVGHW